MYIVMRYVSQFVLLNLSGLKVTMPTAHKTNTIKEHPSALSLSVFFSLAFFCKIGFCSIPFLDVK